MKAVVQRVKNTLLSVDGKTVSEIPFGLTVFLGIKTGDTQKEADYIAKKIANLRVFEDENGKMNKGLADVGGTMMVVSNFTLYADCSHGRRPDFFRAAKPDIAIPVYEHFLKEIRAREIPMITGEFGADMAIDHVNDGPVTILMDTDLMLKKGE